MQGDRSFAAGAPAFDLNSQAGVMMVLAAMRESNLSVQEKNEIRDLVFSYMNGGGDAAVRLVLEQKITKLGLVPAAVSVNSDSAKAVALRVLPYGTSRPTPVFAPATLSISPHKIPTQSATATQAPVVTAVSVAPAGQPPMTTLPVSPKEPTPVAAMPVVLPTTLRTAPVAEPQMTTVPVRSKEPAPVVATPAAIPNLPPITPVKSMVNDALDTSPVEVAPAMPTPAPVIPSPPSTPQPANIDQFVARIQEIKAAVNARVGNPVNLVDIDNVVGREYMGALLDAMKALSSGSGSIPVAMTRLEAAFTAVETVFLKQVPPPSAPPAVPQAPRPVSPLPVSAAVPQEQILTQVPVTPITPAPSVSSPGLPIRPGHDFAPIPPLPTPNPVPSGAFRGMADVHSAMEPLAPVKSLAQEPTKPLTPDVLKTASSLETATVAGDPLFTSEVTNGLNQLLLAWELFRKSGLFGTGPKGMEHPLFKKLAPLPIPLLLAGRFEGATQEIKQSVTDYMNGWRYEQGIIYEQGETFEHYLRRVIKHILNLQNKRGAT